MKTVNTSPDKRDGNALLSGRPVYTEDLAPQGALIVKVLRSPHARARIRSIDTTRALKIPGVVCILTYEDVPHIPYTRSGQSWPELSPCDKRILDQEVRHVGDDVAIIAAETEAAASNALRVIRVDYEILKPVLTLQDALAAEERVHEESWSYTHHSVGFDRDKNIACTASLSGGDFEGALAASEVVLKRTYSTQAQAQMMMETHRAFTYLDTYDRLVVVASTQIPFHTRRILAQALGIPMAKIRVVKPRIGGGFGAKQTAQAEFYPALITLRTGRPAKLVYTREETFQATTTRHAMTFDVTLGASRDGMIRAIGMEVLSDTGAYGDHAETTLGAAGKKVMMLYNKALAWQFNGKALYTNNTPAGALRGFGVTQGTFALETAVNELAAELGMDPVSLRQKNSIRRGESHPLYPKVTKDWGTSEIIMDSCELAACIIQGKQLFSWEERRGRFHGASRHRRGIGMSLGQQGSGLPNIDMSAVTLTLSDDGFITLLTGSTDIGTGSDTVMAQIASEALEIPLDSIVVHAADTDTTAFDTGAYASSTTYTTGNAVIEACKKLIALIEETAPTVLDTQGRPAVYGSGLVICPGTDISVTLKDFARTLTYDRGFCQLSVTGSFIPKKPAPPYVAGFAEVTVDTATGIVHLTEALEVIDCGTLINPKLARIQAEGGMVQGIGLALLEDVRQLPNGKLETDRLTTYKIAARRDLGTLNVSFVESYDATGPYGAKSIGEVVVNPMAPAIIEAIRDACGIVIRDLPVTPQKILKALQEKKEKDNGEASNT